ncbi:hypothetical protein [Desulfosediminicola sp.]|uniref:hypothetical protein n=1 Tax=Desulfosediminicola sp. TaxID=2886825 RepID=UPI003AF2434B
MDINAIARIIAQEVVKQLHEEQPPESRRVAHRILVLGHRNPELERRLRAACEPATDILFSGETEPTQNVDRYVVPQLSCNDMAELATGRAAGAMAGEVLNLLLNGKNVEVLEFEYRTYSDSAAGPLYRLYESYVETLAGFGLTAFSVKKPDFVRCWENLVTEKTIVDAEGQGAPVLQVPAAAKVTPLAGEIARELNIEIQRCL